MEDFVAKWCVEIRNPTKLIAWVQPRDWAPKPKHKGSRLHAGKVCREENHGDDVCGIRVLDVRQLEFRRQALAKCCKHRLVIDTLLWVV